MKVYISNSSVVKNILILKLTLVCIEVMSSPRQRKEVIPTLIHTLAYVFTYLETVDKAMFR